MRIYIILFGLLIVSCPVMFQPLPTWKREPEDTVANVGDDITLYCELNNLPPNKDPASLSHRVVWFIWRTDGTGGVSPNTWFALSENSELNKYISEPTFYPHYSITGKYNLRINGIKDIVRGDYNKFKCEEGLSLMEKEIHILRPVAPNPPTISSVPSSLNNLKAGDNLQLTCSSTGGVEAPTIEWYRDNVKITGHGTVYVPNQNWATSPEVPSTNVHTRQLTIDDNGKTFECKVKNKPLGTKQIVSRKLEIKHSGQVTSNARIGELIGGLVGVLFIPAFIIFILTMRRHQRRDKNRSRDHQLEMEELTADRSSAGDEDNYEDVMTPGTYERVQGNDFEIESDQIELEKEIGNGEFGVVWKGKGKNIPLCEEVVDVAIKTIKDPNEKNKADFLKELEVMKLFSHPNVVRLIACCTENEPYYIIVEYMENGSLKDFLKNNRAGKHKVYDNLYPGTKSLTSRQLLKFAMDVANGMGCLESNKVIHRDLAARNILVDKDLTAKVSDFGFARDVGENGTYERGSEGKLPIRWMAIESLIYNKSTCKSDVWSYGVLLWETISLSATPYPGMGARQIINDLQRGYRMEKPEHCDKQIYKLMMECWNEHPKQRPNFKTIAQILKNIIEGNRDDYIKLDAIPEHIYANVPRMNDDLDELI